ncbi:MAG: thiamine biosynthesis protein ThiS [Alphaproteobacteria bacterium HGW-Alphaproteobacteria-2]|nr:MAG: thiamine biosynthesis protein ThiS [Alphaproteobacteria bacterium HGW-Alphaproteobacteria-2]
MRITVNDEPREVSAATLAEALDELGFGAARIATAVNGGFVPATARAGHRLAEGDRLEVLAPMQGG